MQSVLSPSKESVWSLQWPSRNQRTLQTIAKVVRFVIQALWSPMFLDFGSSAGPCCGTVITYHDHCHCGILEHIETCIARHPSAVSKTMPMQESAPESRVLRNIADKQARGPRGQHGETPTQMQPSVHCSAPAGTPRDVIPEGDET